MFWGCRFFDELSEEKNCPAAGESGGGGGGGSVSPRPCGPEKFFGKFWLFCILNSSKRRFRDSATKNSDESLHQKSTRLGV